MDAKQWGSKFEIFLTEIHAKDYHGCDDDMPDAFNDWLCDLQHDTIIELVGEFILSQHFSKPTREEFMRYVPEEIKDLKEEYSKQDNRITAFPIYVSVQELHCIGVMADGYSVSCPFGDGETKTEYQINSDGDPDNFDTRQEAESALKEQYEDDKPALKEAIKNIQELNVGYIWTPVEFFLTIKGAEEYMKSNAHNHGKLRTYVHHFERRNFEMRNLLTALGFKCQD